MHGETSVSLRTSELEEYWEDNIAMKHSRFYEALEIQQTISEDNLAISTAGLDLLTKVADPKILWKYPEETAPSPFTILFRYYLVHKYAHLSNLRFLDFQLSTRAYH